MPRKDWAALCESVGALETTYLKLGMPALAADDAPRRALLLEAALGELREAPLQVLVAVVAGPGVRLPAHGDLELGVGVPLMEQVDGLLHEPHADEAMESCARRGGGGRECSGRCGATRSRGGWSGQSTVASRGTRCAITCRARWGSSAASSI